MDLLLLSLGIASATPLVVDGEDRAQELSDTADLLWVGHPLQVQVGPSSVVPRLEVRGDRLYWVTEQQVVERAVDSDDTIVLVARAWLLDADEAPIGWVPFPDLAGEPLEPLSDFELPDEPELPIEPGVEANGEDGARSKGSPVFTGAWFGLGMRRGTPERSTMPGLTVQVAGEAGLLYGQFTASYRTKSPSAIRAYFGPPSDRVHQSRYGLGLALGIAPRPLDERTGRGFGALGGLQVAPFAHIGPEVQQYDSWDTVDDPVGIQVDLQSVDTGNWDVGLQTGAGIALRYRHAGLRGGVAWDLRPRAPYNSVIGTVVLVVRP